MGSTVIVIILVVLMVAVGLLVVLMTMGVPIGTRRFKQQAVVSTSLRSLVAAQRQRSEPDKFSGSAARRSPQSLALAAAAESEFSRKRAVASSRMSLAKKLRYAQWSITPIQWRAIEVFVTFICGVPVYLFAGKVLAFLAFCMTPLLLESLLGRGVASRFKAFDGDYPVMLLSYVSLLKTGMNTIGGLESAAKGLDEGSLVRSEVELLIERLRLGLTEEQAINAFGEDIAHPELELFVQSLLLSRRVGGQLSTTLERLAKQVRKRQQFRQQAVAAVGMERGSILMIAAIMTLLLMYLAYSSPELIFPAFQDPTGWKVFQIGISLIVFGFYWSRKVTNIKI